MMGFKSFKPEGRLPTIALVVLVCLISLHILKLLSDSRYGSQPIATQPITVPQTAGTQHPPPSQPAPQHDNKQPTDSHADAAQAAADANAVAFAAANAAATATASSPAPSPSNKFADIPFPRKIWQTAKNGPAGLDDMDRQALRTWAKLNQKWRYESVTQYGAESYVRETFQDRPDLVEVFTDLQDPILRADLVRYLLLLGDGGVYSDLDTKALKPIDDWIPAQYKRVTNVVVGVEYDRLQGLRWLDWTLDLQFTTWAILAKPKHPMLEMTVERVVKALRDLATKQGTTVAGIKPTFEEVLDTTGPAAFTRAAMGYLSNATEYEFTWQNITDLKVPRMVADVLILPINAFGSGQAHSNSGSPDDDTALVQHLFKGSWKTDHPLIIEPSPEDKKEEEEKKKQEEEEKKKQEEEARKDDQKKAADERKKQDEERKQKEDEKKKQEAAKQPGAPGGNANANANANANVNANANANQGGGNNNAKRQGDGNSHPETMPKADSKAPAQANDGRWEDQKKPQPQR